MKLKILYKKTSKANLEQLVNHIFCGISRMGVQLTPKTVIDILEVSNRAFELFRKETNCYIVNDSEVPEYARIKTVRESVLLYIEDL